MNNEKYVCYKKLSKQGWLFQDISSNIERCFYVLTFVEGMYPYLNPWDFISVVNADLLI